MCTGCRDSCEERETKHQHQEDFIFKIWKIHLRIHLILKYGPLGPGLRNTKDFHKLLVCAARNESAVFHMGSRTIPHLSLAIVLRNNLNVLCTLSLLTYSKSMFSKSSKLRPNHFFRDGRVKICRI